MTREPDLAWEALVEVTGANISAERGALNMSLKQIRDETDQLDDEARASEIHVRAAAYRKAFPGLPLTPTALAKHWGRVQVESRATPLVAPPGVPEVRCTLCRNQGWVLVQNSEESAPCPLCLRGAKAETAAYGEGRFWAGRTWQHGSFPGEVMLG